jgi:hypothetical protein
VINTDDVLIDCFDDDVFLHNGTEGGIRIHTVLILSQLPPASWATSAKNWGCVYSIIIDQQWNALTLIFRSLNIHNPKVKS